MNIFATGGSSTPTGAGAARNMLLLTGAYPTVPNHTMSTQEPDERQVLESYHMVLVPADSAS